MAMDHSKVVYDSETFKGADDEINEMLSAFFPPDVVRVLRMSHAAMRAPGLMSSRASFLLVIHIFEKMAELDARLSAIEAQSGMAKSDAASPDAMSEKDAKTQTATDTEAMPRAGKIAVSRKPRKSVGRKRVATRMLKKK